VYPDSTQELKLSMLQWFLDGALVFDQGAEDFVNYGNWVAVAEEGHCVGLVVRASEIELLGFGVMWVQYLSKAERLSR
jgi:hypothetical protein